MASTSESNSFSSSISTPVETPQNQWQLALSQLLANLGQQQQAWAQQQFDTAQGVTDDNISRYIQQADLARQQGQNLWDRYTGVFQPEENQLVQDANTYASTARTQQNMGLAESDVSQAMDQGKHNAEQQLQSFGIDPSSGRYAELEQAQNAQRAAAAAGAGTQAALATQQTGRDLRNQAIAVGQQLPGQSVNAMNTALGGIAGAENSILGLENTGANLMHTADPYFSDAMHLNNPPTSTTSSSHGTTTQQANNPSPAGGGGGSSGVVPMVNPTEWGMGTGGGGGGGSEGVVQGQRGGSLAKFVPNPGAGAGADQTPYGGIGTGMGQNDPFDSGEGYVPPFDPSSYQFGDPSQSGYSDGGTDPNMDYTGVGQDYTPTPGEGTDFSAPTGGQGYGSDSGGGGYAFGAGGDWSTDPGNIDVTNFAKGGVVPTTGGPVPQGASPSQGRQTDDIPARLNAGEYVIPRDVVRHQGTKFFDNLIQKSRALTGQGQKPIGAQQKPALGGPPRFMSRPMQRGVV